RSQFVISSLRAPAVVNDLTILCVPGRHVSPSCPAHAPRSQGTSELLGETSPRSRPEGFHRCESGRRAARSVPSTCESFCSYLLLSVRGSLGCSGDATFLQY